MARRRLSRRTTNGSRRRWPGCCACTRGISRRRIPPIGWMTLFGGEDVMALYDLSAKLPGGAIQSLADYRGQVLLIVNTARSEAGRVGNEWARTCRSWGSPEIQTKTHTHKSIQK